jgi:hypothetical protein
MPRDFFDRINNDGRVKLDAFNSTLPGRSHAGLPALQKAMTVLFAEWLEVRSTDRRRAAELEDAMSGTRELIETLAS